MALSEHNLIWIDLEMSGLDCDRDVIIEIASIVTDGALNILEEGPTVAIYQEHALLSAMDSWNRKQHGKSGLIDRVLASPYTAADAEKMTLDFLQRHVSSGTSPMCGNGICQDRRFLHRSMPSLERFFHYRNLDVSTLKEIIRRWYPSASTFSKDSCHLALEDIRDSIAECRFYREHFFIAVS